MKPQIIPNENGNGFTYAFIADDVEYVNPIQYYADYYIQSRTALRTATLKLENPIVPTSTLENIAKMTATKHWEEEYLKILNTEVPQNLIDVLNCPKKAEQEKLLRNTHITPDILTAFLFRAFNEFGFTFSQYKIQLLPKSIKKEDLPKFATLDKETGKIEKIGTTSLTDGQIKVAIEKRKVIITKFLDNGATWHSFFITFNSIGGEESWRNNQPHFHYISDKFGLSRSVVLDRFKSGDYASTGFHIPLYGYGKQPTNRKDT